MEEGVSWNCSRVLEEADGPVVSRRKYTELPGNLGGAICTAGGCGIHGSGEGTENSSGQHVYANLTISIVMTFVCHHFNFKIS